MHVFVFVNAFLIISIDKHKHLCYTTPDTDTNKLQGVRIMAIKERIRYIRNFRGMTQKALGKFVGFDEKSAEPRIAQYETGARSPKSDMLAKIAGELNVRPEALDVPNIDSYINLAHTLFALEDIYGIKIDSIDGELCLTLDKSRGMTYVNVYEIFKAWHKESQRLKADEVTVEDYNNWKYNYPKAE